MAESRTNCAWTFSLGLAAISVSLEASEAGLTKCCVMTHGDVAGIPPHPDHPLLAQAIRELKEYFAGKRAKFTVPLRPEGTDFQLQVWRATQQIPYGQTRSYWWVAVRMGNPYAVRAVGGALSANPLMLFIPCHRVIRQDGELGGFRPGTSWKRLLLEHEAVYRELLCGR